MGLLSKIFSNTRKPEGFWGRMMVAGMNGGSHAAMASWGLDLANVPAEGEIIDIGCGGGANLARLMDRSLRANVTGVDYSPVSVEKSRKVNAGAIAKGRCKVLEASVSDITCLDYSVDMLDQAKERFRKEEIRNCRLVQGDVGALPFDDASFDIVLTMNGFHAFPDKEKAYSEVNRVLKAGGTLVGCFCIRGESRRTDWLMTRILSRKGWFTPPFETFESLKSRLEKGYRLDEYHKEGSIVYFKATKR